jgi:hypothetical protein
LTFLWREFYGVAPFEHPGPLPVPDLAADFFPTIGLSTAYRPTLVPAPRGESIDALHDRLAYVLHKVAARADADPAGPRAMLLCSHAACMIAMGRVLTGRVPAEVSEEDFGCFTASLSVYRRRPGGAERTARESVGAWDEARPEVVPAVSWRGTGVAGGWECERNADCSFLSGGEERGWWVVLSAGVGLTFAGGSSATRGSRWIRMGSTTLEITTRAQCCRLLHTNRRHVRYQGRSRSTKVDSRLVYSMYRDNPQPR